MSNKESASSALNDLMGNSPKPKKKDIVQEDIKIIESEESYKVVSIRMSEVDKKKLTAHFKKKGIINFSTGIRSIVAEYMESEGLN
jgi:hypothetical protein